MVLLPNHTFKIYVPFYKNFWHYISNIDQNKENGNKQGPKTNADANQKLTSLNDLPPLSQKKSGLEPLDFNPKEENKYDDLLGMGDKNQGEDSTAMNFKGKKDPFSNDEDYTTPSLDEVDKKLKEFGSGNAMKFEVPKASPDKKPTDSKSTKKQTAVDDDYDDDFEDDIVEDLPIEDIDADDHKEKDPFAESGVSASQSMGMDPSVTSLDIEGYDHVEQAIINSPYKM